MSEILKRADVDPCNTWALEDTLQILHWNCLDS